jgi:hypothetical protein
MILPDAWLTSLEEEYAWLGKGTRRKRSSPNFGRLKF